MPTNSQDCTVVKTKHYNATELYIMLGCVIKMKAFILFVLGIALFAGAIVTVGCWFPYQLPAALIGGLLIGSMGGRAFEKISEWVDS